MADLINTTDSLNTGRVKINAIIADASAAVITAQGASTTAGEAKTTANSVQTQLDTIILANGASDAEVVQSRVDKGGKLYATLKERLDSSDAQLADIENTKAEQAALNVEKARIDNLVTTPNVSFYEKTTVGITGALLVVASGATTGQINLSGVTPVAVGYTPIAGDYVRLVYGVATGSAELIDARTGADGTPYSNAGNAVRNQVSNGFNLTRANPITDDLTESTIDGEYYLYTTNFGSARNVLATVYTGVLNTIVPGAKYRVKVYTLGTKTENICNFYDSSGVIISPDLSSFYGYTVIDADKKIVEFTAPANASKMTYTNLLSEKAKGYCKKVLTKLPINWLEVGQSNLDATLTKAIQSIDNALTLTTTGKISNNLVNLYDWGYYLGTTGNHVADAGMGTGYFDAEVGKKYRIKVYSLTSIVGDFAVIYFWTASGTRISPASYVYTVYDEANKIIEITAPVGAVSGTLTYLRDLDPIGESYFVSQSEGKTSYDWLVVNEDNLADALKLKVIPQLKYGHSLDKPFNFTGKTITWFGDSITAGSTSPSLAVTANSYCKLFSDKFGMTYENQAVSGTYICDTVNASSILNKVLNYMTQRDFLVISGGTNDWTFGKPVGALGDTTGDTFYGALHLMCQHLKTNHANAKVIFITPINQNVSRPNAITTMDVYRNAIFEVVSSNGFSVVDGSAVGFPTEQGAFANSMCTDGVHPTELGHSFYAKGLSGILA